MSKDTEKQPVNNSLMYVDYKKMPYAALAKRMLELDAEISEKKKVVSELNAEYDLIRLTIIPERFMDDEITSQNITGVGRLGLTSDMHCNVLKDKKPSFFEWMEEQDYGDLIKPELNSSSLKALIKSLRDSEDEDEQKQYAQIQDFVTIHPFSRASITKK